MVGTKGFMKEESKKKGITKEQVMSANPTDSSTATWNSAYDYTKLTYYKIELSIPKN